MNPCGLRIKTIEASTLLEYQEGRRTFYNYKESLFPNSLFLDFLLSQGITVQKNGTTRDLLCFTFQYSTETCNRAAIRERFYQDGVTVEYQTRRRTGEILTEQIHYRMLYRSTGKAKRGACLFICDRLYQTAHEFLYMGIQLPAMNAPLVEISAYAPLVSSSIMDRICIHPENILILKDVTRTFQTNVVSVETDESNHCIAKHLTDYMVKNTLFDGQALIDDGLFPQWAEGYILLRHHFCKMAAFRTRIQDFFRDYFGDTYATATVTDMFGIQHNVRDIEVITTDNAMKWLKFDVSYPDWCQNVHANGCQFGIVKTAHESKLGNVQRMSYQMVNSLDLSSMEAVTKESVNYVNQLKQEDDVFLHYLEQNQNFSNDYQVLLALCRQNPDFIRSTYFRDRRRSVIQSYVCHMRSGHLIQNADNLVLVGSPYAMLLYGATGDASSVDLDTTFQPEPDAIQCYTSRFADGDYLAGFRSPFNGRGNLSYLHNVHDPRFDAYFPFGRQVLAVNLIGTDFQDRNNGSDQDSDSLYTTNQPEIVAHARHCYRTYPTIVNNLTREQTHYTNSPAAYAAMDHMLAGAQAAIGDSSNLAQLAQTYSYNYPDPYYEDAICILSVLAQAAIDNAKRRFSIRIPEEINRIRRAMDIATHGYPVFWSVIKPDVDPQKLNPELVCPMNYLYQLKLPRCPKQPPALPMSHFFCKYEMHTNIRTCRKVEQLIADYSLQLYGYNTSANPDDTDYLLLREDFENLISDIRHIRISSNYLGLFSWIIDRCFKILPGTIRNQKNISSTVHKNRSLMLKVLYEINPDNLLKCFAGHSDADSDVHSDMSETVQTETVQT